MCTYFRPPDHIKTHCFPFAIPCLASKPGRFHSHQNRTGTAAMASTVAGAPRFERTSVERVESPMAESPPRVTWFVAFCWTRSSIQHIVRKYFQVMKLFGDVICQNGPKCMSYPGCRNFERGCARFPFSPIQVISLQALHKRSSPLNLTHQHLSHGLLVCGDGLVVFFESKAYLAAGFSKMFFLSPSSWTRKEGYRKSVFFFFILVVPHKGNWDAMCEGIATSEGMILTCPTRI